MFLFSKRLFPIQKNKLISLQNIHPWPQGEEQEDPGAGDRAHAGRQEGLLGVRLRVLLTSFLRLLTNFTQVSRSRSHDHSDY